MTNTPNDRVGRPDGVEADPGKILFVGSSPQLDGLRTWVRSRHYSIVEQPAADVGLVVADEDVLDGLCTAEQGVLMAASRALGLTCVPPGLADTWLGGRAATAKTNGAAVLRTGPHAGAAGTPLEPT